MRAVNEEIQEEAAVLSRAIENVIRKLIRFLIGRVSLVSLQEIVKYVFVEEVENKLRRESPNKNIPLTKLALLSGLDTRTLTKIRNSDSYRQPLHREADFLREFTPGAYLIDVWSGNAPYIDEKTGKPKTLAVSGGELSFESLFESHSRARGVTYTSLLERLVESGSVEINRKKNEVKLKLKSYLPSRSTDQMGAIEMGFSAIGNMIDTVTGNIIALEAGGERLYQRGAWTYRLSDSHRSALKAELHRLLEKTDSDARQIIENHEDRYSSRGQITAGISLFYFEETQAK